MRYLLSKILEKIQMPNHTGLYTKTSITNTTHIKEASVTNVLSYGADPTGRIDSKTAFQNAINNTYFRKPLWIPRGTYLLSGPIAWSGKSYNNIMGECEKDTILLVKKGSPAFQDANNPQSLIKYGYQNNAPGQAFSNYLSNLTIVCQENNPGFRAVSFIAANTGGINNVTIQSLGAADTGISFDATDNCCSLLENIKIIGAFKTGIDFVHYSDNAVINGVYIEGSTYTAIRLYATFHLTCRNLETRLPCPVVRSGGGSVQIEDSTIVYTGTGSETAFIDADFSGNTWTASRTFLNRVNVQGYSQAYQHKTNNALSFASISSSEQKHSYTLISTNPSATGILPTITLDAYPDLNPYQYPLSSWIYAGDPTNWDDYWLVQEKIYNQLDKKVLCFQSGRAYKNHVPFEIPSNSQIQVILGNCSLQPQDDYNHYQNPQSPEPIFYIRSNPLPLLIRGFEGYVFDVPNGTADAVHNLDGRTIILEDSSFSYVRQTGGKLFMKTCVVGFEASNVEARLININPEGSLCWFKNGSKVDILGSKTETAQGPIYKITTNSTMSMRGAHHLGNVPTTAGVPLIEADGTAVYGIVGQTSQTAHDVVLRANGTDILYSNLPSGTKPFPSTWKGLVCSN